MKTVIAAFTQNGAHLAKKLADALGADGYVIEKYVTDGLKPFKSLTELVDEKFDKSGALIFVGACGIAVRAIAPRIKDKSTDPAVLVIDERCKFVIPVLSGHIGGANGLARRIAKITGALPVITTATDINGKFAVDTFAVENNLRIGDTKLIKEISSRVLNGEKIGIASDFPLKNIPDIFTDKAEAGIYIGGDGKEPFRITLTLSPRNYILGIGCKKDCETVEETALDFLKTNGVGVRSLSAAATVDIKKNERGILEFCDKYDLPLFTYSAEELSRQKGDFTSSEFVKKTVGTDNVCERAVCAAGGELTVKKTTRSGAAFALGRVKTEIDFAKGVEVE